MSGAVLNSRLLTRLLTSGEEDIEHVSMLKEDISTTVCELTMLIFFGTRCIYKHARQSTFRCASTKNCLCVHN